MFMRKVIDTFYNNLKNREVLIVDTLPTCKKLKELTIIDNVRIADINRISKMIIEENKHAIIYQIYYITQKKCLIVEASKKLKCEDWNKKMANCLTITGDNSFLKYLKSLLLNLRVANIREVNAFQIKELYDKYDKEFKMVKLSIKEEIEYLIKLSGQNHFVSNIFYNYKTDVVTIELDRSYKINFELVGDVVINSPIPYLDDTILKIKELYTSYSSFYLSEMNVKSTNSKFYLKGNFMEFKIYLKDRDDKELFAYNYSANSDNFEITSWKDLHLALGEEIDLNTLLDGIYFDYNELPLWLNKEFLKQRKEEISNRDNKIKRILKKFLSI